MNQDTEKVRCLIIGGGPAGYTAAIYTSRANLAPVLYEGMLPGGQLTITTEVENFPGYPDGVTGTDMMDDIRRQAERFGTDLRSGDVTKVDFSKRPFAVTIDEEKQILADSIIIATGAGAKYLGLSDEKAYNGKGVSACATCDGFFYRKKRVAVVGGGDTACEEALYLAGLCEKVFLIVRKPFLRAAQIMQDRVFSNEKIEVLFEHQTVGLFGDGKLAGAHLVKRKGEKDEENVDIDIQGFFLAIGRQPNTELFKDTPLKLDAKGYIITNPGCTCTNIAGVFAAGDVADPIFQQAVTAAASGCKAAKEVENFLFEQ